MKQTRREFVRTLFAASQGIIASGFLPVNLLADSTPAPESALNFLIFGDWGREGELDQTQVATQMAKTADAIGAKFVISVGDNFYEEGVVSTTDAQWRKSFEDVYHARSLQVPWQVILGNHDYRGNCDAQLAYGAISSRWNMPARYFKLSRSLDAKTTADFFFLDTTPMIAGYYWEAGTRANVKSQDVPQQLEWFENALATSTAQWKIVIGHHPIYSGGKHGDTPDLVKKVLPLLHQYQVPIYFNGHDHDLQHLITGDINLVCTGAGSKVRATVDTRNTKFAQAIPGFVSVSLRPAKMDIRMIDNHGAMLYGTTVLPNIPKMVSRSGVNG
jgi:acid phosphatase